MTSAPFRTFEDIYLAHFAMTQEAEKALSSSSAHAIAKLSSVALLRSFDEFCVLQVRAIYRLRPDLKVIEKRSDGTDVIDLINRSFRKALGKNLVSPSECLRYRRIVHQCSLFELPSGLAPNLIRKGKGRSEISWPFLSSVLFDLAVKVARATGVLAKADLDPTLPKHRAVIRSVDGLLRARFDVLA